MLTVPKVTLDQFVFSPIALAVFFTCTTLMEGKSLEDVQRKLRAVCNCDRCIVVAESTWVLFASLTSRLYWQTGCVHDFRPLHFRAL